MSIFTKKVRFTPLADFPGYEATDAAFWNAHVILLDVLDFEGNPEWSRIGVKSFRKLVKNEKIKVYSEDMPFLEEYLPKMWDSIRFKLLNTDHIGDWEMIKLEIHKDLVSMFTMMQGKYRPGGPETIQAAGTLWLGLETITNGMQILAMPLIENVLIVWVHYCNWLLTDN